MTPRQLVGYESARFQLSSAVEIGRERKAGTHCSAAVTTTVERVLVLFIGPLDGFGPVCSALYMLAPGWRIDHSAEWACCFEERSVCVPLCRMVDCSAEWLRCSAERSTILQNGLPFFRMVDHCGESPNCFGPERLCKSTSDGLHGWFLLLNPHG